MNLQTYLESRLSPASCKIYLFEIHHFISYFGKEKSEVASHQDIINYLNYLRGHYQNGGTINRIIQAIKQYFFYLTETGKREDHPCRFLSIKDRQVNQIQVQDLLKPTDLESLLNRKERYEILTIRNQVVMSLLVYQALRIREMCELKTTSIDLEKGRIKIKATPKTNGRTLCLKPNQILLFYKYLNEIRKKLLKERNLSAGGMTEALIITKAGTAEKGEGIHYLVSTFRKQLPDKKLTPTTIRQSVITNLLAAGTDLRIVQVFAGHKKPGATEKYRQTNFDALKEAVHKFHPLN